MSEYGSGVSMKQAFNMDRERIIEALKGRLACGENEHGFEYIEATREECEEFILSAFDNAVYMATQLAASGRTLERILQETGQDNEQIFKRYLKYRQDEERAIYDPTASD